MSGRTLGERLRQARRELAARRMTDVTQADVAAAVGVTAVTISRYESDLKEPTLQMIANLACVLGVTPGRLAFGDDADRVPEAPKVHRTAGQPVPGTPAPRGSGKARDEAPAVPRRSSGGGRRRA